MASLLDQAFGSSDVDLYQDVLQVSKTCTPAQLRKAYYKQAMTFHPDKNDAPDAKHKFQAISWTYNFLKDPQKRKDYDEDGILPHNDMDDDDDDEDDDDNEGRKNWKDYFQTVFGTVTTNDIDSFAMKYKMSDEEEKDVLENYTKFKGNLFKMMEYVMLSTERDVPRWVEDSIRPAIAAGKVERYEKTLNKSLEKIEKKLQAEKAKEAKQQQKQAKEFDPDETDTEDSADEQETTTSSAAAKKASSSGNGGSKQKATAAHKAKPTKAKKKQKKETKKNSEQDLIAAIRNKKRGGNNPFASIAARYGVADIDDPLDDAAFTKLQSKYKKK